MGITIILGLLSLTLLITCMQLFRGIAKERKGKENLIHLLETIPIGVCHVDKELEVIWCNKKIKNLYEMPEDCFGSNLAEYVNPNIIAIVKETLAGNDKMEVISFEGGLSADKTPVFEYAPGVRWMKLSYVPILSEQGNLLSYVILNEDTTDEKRAEHQLLVNNKTIQLQLRKIEDLNSGLSEANAHLDKFAAMASHDLKSPLKVIHGFAGLLANKEDEEFGPQDRRMANYMEQCTKQMGTLIEDLLTFCRLDQKLDDPVPVQTSKIVDKALFNLQCSIKEKKANVHFDKLPKIVVQESLVLQLFQNILGNALKFTESVRHPQITLSSEPAEGQFVLFTIADNGIGIKPEKTKEIFQAFTRLHNKNQYEGTGLGLAICKKIVEFHQGKIWIESEQNVGTSVKFTLPLAT